jgi:hypothetical protein
VVERVLGRAQFAFVCNVLNRFVVLPSYPVARFVASLRQHRQDLKRTLFHTPCAVENRLTDLEARFCHQFRKAHAGLESGGTPWLGNPAAPGRKGHAVLPTNAKVARLKEKERSRKTALQFARGVRPSTGGLGGCE